jgi:uncharacterized protein
LVLVTRHIRMFFVVLALTPVAGLVFGGILRASDNPLAVAARNGDLATVLGLLEGQEDVNTALGDGSTPLLWAAYNFDVDMARALIDAGADADVANNYGITPLIQASRNGDDQMVALLLEAGADASLAHPDGSTPLMAAARSGNPEAVRLLLDHGADANAADSYQNETALMWAAGEGHTDVVGLLLDAGADPDIQARVSSLTTRRNADHPTGGFTALMWAARNGHEITARRLVEGGANSDLKNGDGASATMIAIYNDRFDLAKTLVDLGADVNDGSLYTAVEMRASTTDQFAFDGSRLRPDNPNELTSLDLIEILLERGADPNQWFDGQFHSTSMPNGDRFNNTPLFRAAVAADAEALKVFGRYVDDVDAIPEPPAAEEPAPDGPPGGGRGRGNANAGRTATMLAMTGGRAPAMTGGPGYIRDGDAPYREAGSRKPEDALAALLDAGANPNAATPDGATLLHQAAQAGNLDMIRALADAGADLSRTNSDGFTALDVAEGKRPEGRGNGGGPRGGPPAARGGRGRGGRGGANPEVAALLRELMGLPPAPPSADSAEEADDAAGEETAGPALAPTGPDQ